MAVTERKEAHARGEPADCEVVLDVNDLGWTRQACESPIDYGQGGQRDELFW